MNLRLVFSLMNLVKGRLITVHVELGRAVPKQESKTDTAITVQPTYASKNA